MLNTLLPRPFSIPLALIFISAMVAMTSTQTMSDQRLEIPSSVNPVGSGARALGMGGAFIAVADDATAASWNPGGLIQLERPEISFALEGFHRSEDNTFSRNPEAEGTQGVDKIDLNYFSAAYPFQMRGRNMIVSLNYQKQYDFSREWKLDLHNSGSNYSEQETLNYKQSGDLSALGVAYSIQATPHFSLGFTLNFWEDNLKDNGWKEQTNQSGSGIYDGDHGVFDTRRTDRYSFSGINANFGLLWQATGHLTVGAVLKSPFKADVAHTRSQYYAFYFPDSEAPQATVTHTSEALRLTMPMSYGIGAAYRFSDAFTLALDLYRTHWNDFEFEDQTGIRTSPVTGKPVAETNVDPTTQVRLGCEYLIILPQLVIPIRGGIFYDPAPAEGNPDDYYGFSLGSGLVFDRVTWDIAGQYRFGSDVSDAIMPGYGFSQDVSEFTVYTSAIVYF